MSQKQPKGTVESPGFEESLAKLEAVVAELEDGQLTLGDALARYEEGVRHLKLCYQSLRDIERKVELLAGVDSEGRPVTQPFDDEATKVDAQPPARGRRRSNPANKATGGSTSADVGDIDDSPGLF